MTISISCQLGGKSFGVLEDQVDLRDILIRQKSEDNKNLSMLNAIRLLSEGKIDDGKKLLNQAGLEGESNAHILLGFLANKREARGEALEHFLEAIKMNNPLGHFYIGLMYFELKDYKKSYSFFSIAHESNILQSKKYLEICRQRLGLSKKEVNEDGIWYVLFGPLFFLKSLDLKGFIWCSLMHLTVLFSISKNPSFITIFISYVVCNFFFILRNFIPVSVQKIDEK